MTFLLNCCVSWRLVATHLDDDFLSLKQLRLASHRLSAVATPSLFQRHCVSLSRDPRVMRKILANDFLRNCVQQLTIEVREISRFDYPQPPCKWPTRSTPIL
ncbi:hypothetical protein BJX65DRAFT_281993, partial [Aspergillus insuetus]